MIKHTKGPWRVCGGSTPSYIGIHSTDGYVVYGLADRLDHKERGKPIVAPSFEVQRANARLIAKSPEMYDFVEAIAEHFTHDTDRDEVCRPNCRVCWAVKLLAEIGNES